MHWTNRLPIQEGWYWVRDTPTSLPFPRYIWKDNQGLWCITFSGSHKIILDSLFYKNSDFQISNENLAEPINNFEDKNEELC